MASPSPGPSASPGSGAILALVLGVLGLLGGLGSCCCCLFAPLAVCAPLGWFFGHRELAAIRAGRSPAAGEGLARGGMLCGMIGTGLLGLYLMALLVYVALVGFGAASELLKGGGVPPLHR